jgi:hypothetical protein
MRANDFLLARLGYHLRAQAVHRAFIAVRGRTPPPTYSNTPEWELVPWELAVIDGRSSAVVVQLLLQELSVLESLVIDQSWYFGRQ